MSEDKKPKKDLRARLGRTIAPNTPGAPPIAAPGGVIAPPTAAPVAAPTPAAPSPAGAPPAAARPAAAPQVIAPPMAAPASKTPFGGADIAPPPFARPAPAAEPKPEPRRRSADPFAAGPAAADQVRLVIDEAPHEDPRVAARARTRNLIVVAISLVVGAVVGAGASTANGSRNLYNITVRDGHDVFETFDGASHVVLEAQQHMDAIAASASGGGADHHPSVNYDEIAALVALENPLHAGAFARKNYNRFPAATVDDLFAYDHNVQELWEDFTHLNGITSGPARRATLDQTAAATVCPADLGHDEAAATAAIQAAQQATTDAANAQYVALLQATDDGTIQGTLGFAEQDFDATTHQPTDRIFMRAGRGGPGRPFDRWTPGTPIGTTPAGVISIDGPGSAAVLGDRIGSFRAFAQSLEETRALMRETIEIQQRLTTALGEIHNLQEEFAL